MFKNPFSFDGRIRRTEYGLSFIIANAVSFMIQVGAATSESAGVMLILLIPLLWFAWAQGAKRCHDLGNSGWYQIIPFYVFWLIFAAGHVGENEYGADPKADPSLENSAAKQALTKGFSRDVVCQKCNATLELSSSEIADKRFTCPQCGTTTTLIDV